ncbi:TRAP-type C4-dicarboxylate transport system permease small subunit [Neorhizobium galegae]|uniref:TRAP transporter small permease n=1 Tax=Rhizobium/Agrobacterium group TaxID=227290 RepID=UPI001AE61F6C|nr:TRAP transporter small permease [Neorhizobium galegae]MBP2550772.1 TRAP-type C4-dicarboxylate transport system permease small subunit [Neorhizobium galegae]
MTEHPHAPISVEEMAHAFEEDAAPVDLSPYAIEDWVTLIVFWSMGLSVFLQFFTRYVLNDSLAWTEEIAANCLVVVVFLGSVMCVRTMRHIQVDLLYRFLPTWAVRPLELVVDIIGIIFFAYITWLMWRYLEIVGEERMVTVDLPRGIVFYSVFAAFALMFVRSAHNLFKDLTGNKTVRQQAQDDLHAGGI